MRGQQPGCETCGRVCFYCNQPRPEELHCKSCFLRDKRTVINRGDCTCVDDTCEYGPWLFRKPRSIVKRMVQELSYMPWRDPAELLLPVPDRFRDCPMVSYLGHACRVHSLWVECTREMTCCQRNKLASQIFHLAKTFTMRPDMLYDCSIDDDARYCRRLISNYFCFNDSYLPIPYTEPKFLPVTYVDLQTEKPEMMDVTNQMMVGEVSDYTSPSGHDDYDYNLRAVALGIRRPGCIYYNEVLHAGVGKAKVLRGDLFAKAMNQSYAMRALSPDSEERERRAAIDCLQSLFVDNPGRTCRSNYSYPGFVCANCCDCDISRNYAGPLCTQHAYALQRNDFTDPEDGKQKEVVPYFTLQRFAEFTKEEWAAQIGFKKVLDPMSVNARMPSLRSQMNTHVATLKQGQAAIMGAVEKAKQVIAIPAKLQACVDAFWASKVGQAISWCMDFFYEKCSNLVAAMKTPKGIAIAGVSFCILFHKKLAEFFTAATDTVFGIGTWIVDAAMDGIINPMLDSAKGIGLTILRWLSGIWSQLREYFLSTEKREIEEGCDDFSESFVEPETRRGMKTDDWMEEPKHYTDENGNKVYFNSGRVCPECCWRYNKWGDCEHTKVNGSWAPDVEVQGTPGKPDGAAVIVAAALLGAMPGVGDTKAVIPHVIRTGIMLTQSAEYVKSGVEYLMKRLPGSIKDCLKKAGIYQEQDHDAELNRMLATMHVYLVAREASKMDANMATHFLVLYEQLQSELLRVANDERRQSSVMAIKEILRRTDPLLGDIKTQAKGADRREPEGAIFYGLPGAGKSFFTVQLVNLIYPGQPGSMYCNSAYDTFCSGLQPSKHKVYCNDDWFQCEKNISEQAQMIICMISKTDFRPNFPVAEDKGQTYAPELVVLTTNKDINTVIPGIDMGAWWRRFKHAYEVVCDAAVQDENKVFCYDKFKKMPQEYQDTMAHLRFYKFVRAKNVLEQNYYDKANPMSFMEVAYRLKAAIKYQEMAMAFGAEQAKKTFDAFTKYEEYKMAQEHHGPVAFVAQNQMFSGVENELERKVLSQKRAWLMAIKKVLWIPHNTSVAPPGQVTTRVMGYEEFIRAPDQKEAIENMYRIYSAYMTRSLDAAGVRGKFYLPDNLPKMEMAMSDINLKPSICPWVGELKPLYPLDNTGVETRELIVRINQHLQECGFEMEDEHFMTTVVAPAVVGFDADGHELKEEEITPTRMKKLEEFMRWWRVNDGENTSKYAAAVKDGTPEENPTHALEPSRCMLYCERADAYMKARFKAIADGIRSFVQSASFDKMATFSVDVVKVGLAVGSAYTGLKLLQRLLHTVVGGPQEQEKPRYRKEYRREGSGARFVSGEVFTPNVVSQEDLKPQRLVVQPQGDSDWSNQPGTNIKVNRAEQARANALMRDKNFAKGLSEPERWMRAKMQVRGIIAPQPHLFNVKNQGVESDSATNKVLEKILRNQCAIYHDSGEWFPDGKLYGFFLRGRELVLPMHFFHHKGRMIDDGTWVRVRMDGGSFDTKFEKERLRLFHCKVVSEQYRYDFAVYEMPSRVGKGGAVMVPEFQDLSNYFKPHLSNTQVNEETCAIGQRYDPEERVETTLFSQFTAVADRVLYTDTGSSLYDLACPGQLLYDVLENGECGTLIIEISPAGLVTIDGMHICERPWKGGRIGMGFPIYRGLFDELDVQVQGYSSEWHPPLVYRTHLKELEPITGGSPPLNKPSKIVESPLAGHKLCKDVTRRPAHLSNATCPLNGEQLTFKELDRGFTAEEYVREPYDKEQFEICHNAIRDAYFRAMDKSVLVRKLTMQEAMSGGAANPSLSGLQPVNNKKCSGDPWAGLPGAHGKEHLMRGKAGEREIHNMEFKIYLEWYLDQLQDASFHERHKENVMLFLKDELRSAEKTDPEDPITRIIQAFGCHHLLAMRIYFGAWINFNHTKYDQLPSCVGMDPYSQDWDTLIKRLAAVGKRGFAGDYKKFEKLFCHQVAEGFVRLVNEWYEQFGSEDWCIEDNNARYNLVMMTLECNLLVGNRRFEKEGELKSGVACTTLMGNYMNDLLLRLAWLWVHEQEQQDTDMGEYDRHVAKGLFSDDNVNTVHDRKLGIYNFVSVQRVFAEHGITYTSADKTDKCVAHEPIQDLEFLKCKSRIDRGMIQGVTYHAVPSSRDMSSLKWISKGLDPLDAVHTNATNLLLRNVGAGRVEYDALRNELSAALLDVGAEATLPSHQQALNLYKNKGIFLSRAYEMEELLDAAPYNWEPKQLFLTKKQRDFYERVKPQKVKQLPSIVNHYTRDYYHRPRTSWFGFDLDSKMDVRCQMEGGGNAVMGDVSQVEEAAAVQVTLEADSVPVDVGERIRTRDWMGDDSLTELMKRFTYITRDIGTLPSTLYWPLGAQLLPGLYITNQTTTLNPMGATAWLAPLFAYWWTGFRYKFIAYSANPFKIHFLTERRGDQPLSYGNMNGYNGMMGPYQLNMGPQFGQGTHQVDPYSEYNFFRMPLNASMAANDNFCCNNMICFTSVDNSNAPIYTSTGDAPRFFCLRSTMPVAFYPWTTNPLPKERTRRSTLGSEPEIIDVKNQMESGTGVSIVGLIPDEQTNVRPWMEPEHTEASNEKQYDLVQMAERPQMITAFNWSNQAAGSTLASFSVPGDLIKGSASVPFNNFTYWSGVTEVTIDVNSTFGQVGMLMVYFVPDMDQTKIDMWIGSSLASWFMNMHRLINAGGSRSAKFRIPFVHPLLRFDTKEIGVGYSPLSIVNLGTLVISVLNPLIVAVDNSANTATVSVYARFPANGLNTFSLLRGQPMTRFPFSKMRREYDEDLEPESRKGKLARITEMDIGDVKSQGAVGSFLYKAGNVAFAAQQTVDAVQILRGQDRRRRGRRDKPAITAEYPLIIQGRCIELCNTNGVGQVLQLGARACELRDLTDNDVGTTVNECSVAHISSIWNYQGIFIWSASQLSGQRLLSVPCLITPQILSAVNGVTMDMGVMERVAHMFNYWNCRSFDLRLILTKNRVSSGRLFVSITYQAETLIPVTFAQAIAGYGAYFDISGPEQEFVITVPWNSDRRWMVIPHSPGYNNLDQIAFGVLTVWVVNPLVVDSSTPSYIYANVLWRVNDVCFQAPGYGCSRLKPVNPYGTFETEPDKDNIFIDPDGNPRVTACPLCGYQHAYPQCPVQDKGVRKSAGASKAT